MKKIPNHTALKEWSTVIDALGRGEQVILIRKGGIADPAFAVEAERFYLYPTYFHQGESEARSQFTISSWCEVVRTWTTRDKNALDRIAPVVALPEATIAARYSFRPDQALTIMGVRTWRLPAPVEVRYREEYGGCRSWVSIDDEIDIDASEAVLSSSEMRSRLDRVEAAIVSVAAAS